MKNSEIIFAVGDSAEGGYEAHALGHAIVTEADSFEELKKMVCDAAHCHFDDGERPAAVRLHYVRGGVNSP
jgi:hypothetical protein